uniref:Uncharacterized protein n=1 Tax=Anguilla anguilla TaxID=7936 RepID=A0A0E9V0B2_ANGAN
MTVSTDISPVDVLGAPVSCPLWSPLLKIQDSKTGLVRRDIEGYVIFS